MVDRGGSMIDKFTFVNNHQGIDYAASRLTMDDRAVRVHGTIRRNLSGRFDERQMGSVDGNPLKTRAMSSAKIKSDKLTLGYWLIY
jgi:hypothetical protein